MITDGDLTKIRRLVKEELKEGLTEQDKRFDQKLSNLETNLKKYIHQGVDAVVAGVDNLLTEYQFDSRLKRLEKIHSRNSHTLN